MAELAKFVINFEGRLKKLESSMIKAERFGKKTSDKIERDFQSINADIKMRVDNSIAKMSINEVRKLRSKLKAELEKKIKMNVSTASIERTRIKIDSVNQALRELPKRSTKAGSSITKMAGKLALAGVAFLAFRKALSFTVEAKNLARDATEVQNKFNEVFISLEKSANKQAKVFAQSFGLATSTAKEFLSATGDILVGFGFAEDKAFEMSLAVNRLAQDLASFANLEGGAEQASLALTKALVGETESAKALGIVIRQDTKEFKLNVQALQDSEGLTLIQAKSMEILRIAYEQSGKAVGDFARTQFELANAERILSENIKTLQENIGSGLTPALTGMIGIMNNILAPTKSLSEQYQVQVGSIENLKERIDPLVATYKELKKKGEDVSIVVKQITAIMPDAVVKWDSYGNAVEISTEKIAKSLLGLQLLAKFRKGEAIEQDTESLKLFSAQIEEATLKLNKLNTEGTIKHVFPPFKEFGKPQIVDLKLEGKDFTNKISEFRSEIKLLNEAFIGAVESLKDMDQAVPEEFVERYERLLSAGVGVDTGDGLKKQSEFVKNILNGLKQEKKQIEQVKEALANAKLSDEERVVLQETLNGLLGDQTDQFKTIKDTLEGVVQEDDILLKQIELINAKLKETSLTEAEVLTLERERASAQKDLNDVISPYAQFIDDIINANDELVTETEAVAKAVGDYKDKLDEVDEITGQLVLQGEARLNVEQDLVALAKELVKLKKELFEIAPEFILPMDRPRIEEGEFQEFEPEEVQESMDEVFEKSKKDAKEISDTFRTVTSQSQQIANVLNIGADTFGAKLIGFLNEAVSIASSVASVIASVFSIASGGFLGTAVGALARAHGGHVDAQKPYVVGEKGAELFVPTGSGEIIPNNQLSKTETIGRTGNIGGKETQLNGLGVRIENLIEAVIAGNNQGQTIHTVLEVDGDVLAEKQYFNENRAGVNTRNTGDIR